MGGALLVAGSQPTPLLKPIDAAFDHIAARIDHLVEGERTTWPSRPLRELIAPLRNEVRDLAPSQHLATARVAVAFVSNEPIGTRPWASSSARSWDADAVQDGLQLGIVMALSRRDHDRERSPFAVAGQMHLARQPAATASEALVGGMADPFFSSARLGRRRAPLACW